MARLSCLCEYSVSTKGEPNFLKLEEFFNNHSVNNNNNNSKKVFIENGSIFFSKPVNFDDGGIDKTSFVILKKDDSYKLLIETKNDFSTFDNEKDNFLRSNNNDVDINLTSFSEELLQSIKKKRKFSDLFSNNNAITTTALQNHLELTKQFKIVKKSGIYDKSESPVIISKLILQNSAIANKITEVLFEDDNNNSEFKIQKKIFVDINEKYKKIIHPSQYSKTISPDSIQLNIKDGNNNIFNKKNTESLNNRINTTTTTVNNDDDENTLTQKFISNLNTTSKKERKIENKQECKSCSSSEKWTDGSHILLSTNFGKYLKNDVILSNENKRTLIFKKKNIQLYNNGKNTLLRDFKKLKIVNKKEESYLCNKCKELELNQNNSSEENTTFKLKLLFV